MRQRPIDLLPESIRARSRAGALTGRFLTAALSLLVALTVVSMHAAYRSADAESRLNEVRSRAKEVIQAEELETALRERIDRLHKRYLSYNDVALSIPMTGVLSTVVNMLPDRVVLERIYFDSSSTRGRRTVRGNSAGESNLNRPRFLRGEIGGVADSDEAVASLVLALESKMPFESVSLDSSRYRMVGIRSAWEFNISFKIDLDRIYDIVIQDGNSQQVVMEVNDAN